MTRTIKVTFEIERGNHVSALEAARDCMHLATAWAPKGTAEKEQVKRVLGDLEKLLTSRVPGVGPPLQPKM